jgi:DNA-binding Xre family transcriptional regulator
LTKVKYYRLKNNLKQTELSSISEVKLSTVQKLDSGFNDIRKSSYDTIEKIAGALSVEVEDLIGFINDEDTAYGE